jgi:glycosyltransferase involved in cell wall biosynthesis
VRIVRIVSELDFGGVEKRLELTAREFAEGKDNQLIVLVLHRGGTASRKISQLGIDVRVLGRLPKIPNMKLVIKLLTILKELQPSVVHCSGAEANFHGLLASWMAGVPTRIGEEIGFPNHDWKWRVVFQWVYKTATDLIAISHSVKDRIVALGEVEKDKVMVVYNPVDFAASEGEIVKERLPRINSAHRQIVRTEFNEEGSPDRPAMASQVSTLVTTCRLVPVKNLDMLLRVFAELVKEGRELVLWIVGDGPDMEKMRYLSAELGLEHKVVFWGFQENVLPILEDADIFVLPSFSEGFSISLVEAMGNGLISIATRVGGPSEIIRSDTGFLIDPLRAEDIKEKILLALELSPEQRFLMGSLAKADVQQRFSLKKYSSQLREIYTRST